MEEMRTARLCEGFPFTKGMPVLQIKGGYGISTLGFALRKLMEYGTMLFDLEQGSKQEYPIQDETVEAR